MSYLLAQHVSLDFLLSGSKTRQQLEHPHCVTLCKVCGMAVKNIFKVSAFVVSN